MAIEVNMEFVFENEETGELDTVEEIHKIYFLQHPIYCVLSSEIRDYIMSRVNREGPE